MKKNIHFFSQNNYNSESAILEKIGQRGKQAMELATLDLPIQPGFIIDAEVASQLGEYPIREYLEPFFSDIASITGKTFGDPENPMLVKIVISPNLVISNYPGFLHDYGLTNVTLPGFIKFVGDNFGYHELQFLMRGSLTVEERIAELENDEERLKDLREEIAKIEQELAADISVDKRKKSIEKHVPFFPDSYLEEPYDQLEIALKRVSKLLELDDLNQEDTAILIQPMVYGNYGKDSAFGSFFTRNIVDGDNKLQGKFYQGEFNELEATGDDINNIAKKYRDELEKIARTMEDHFKEIRSVRFTIENKKLWLIDQRGVMTKSTQAELKTLLDLSSRNIIDEKEMVSGIKPGRLNEILHPIIDTSSVEKLKSIGGGITGAPGAAIGRIFFSTTRLLEAHRNFQQRGEDTNCILCMVSTFAEDVKAIEVSKGVLSSEGGYAAHASVVARQYGKVSLVKPELKIREKSASIGAITLNEGDYISLNVPFYGESKIYLGKAGLIELDPKESGLLTYMESVARFVNKFHVRVNADSPREVALAKTFGAEGIGLCRTEHMFFHEERINVFRELILADSKEKNTKALKKLGVMQRSDFHEILKIMAGYEVTIRLLDAPLHEFMPHNPEEMKEFVKYLRSQSGSEKVTEKDVRAGIDALSEFNPMLGHRGCRIAVSYPEIYEMQVRAIFEAVYSLKKEGIDAKPEIMIPLIMNDSELKLIIYGKKIEGKSTKGLIDVEREVREEMKADSIDYKIGTMIELPVAALGAGDIAKYAQFFSFGTNDLTQTTIGLSRDDFNTFMPDYTQFDLLQGNPFQILNEYVKELVMIAVKRGRLARPDLKTGLCGEHGAIPENIEFCMNAGLDYVSCSSYSVPIAKLAVAQQNLKAET